MSSIRMLLGDEASDPLQRPNAETKLFSQKGVVVNTSLVHDRMSLAQYAADSLVQRFEAITAVPRPATMLARASSSRALPSAHFADRCPATRSTT